MTSSFGYETIQLDRWGLVFCGSKALRSRFDGRSELLLASLPTGGEDVPAGFATAPDMDNRPENPNLAVS